MTKCSSDAILAEVYLKKEVRVKKKLVLSLIVVALVAALTGGIVYAATSHQIPSGQNLIGMGIYGISGKTESLNANLSIGYYFNTQYTVTNPNDQMPISISYFTIFDESGNILVGGTPRQLNSSGYHVPTQLGPHQIWKFGFDSFLGNPPVIPDSTPDTPLAYTVQVTWNVAVASQNVRPLMGTVEPFGETFKCFGEFNPNLPSDPQVDDLDMTAWANEMVNFPQ